MSEGDGPPDLQYEDETLTGRVATEASEPLETSGYHGGTTLSPYPFVELANRIQLFFNDHREDKSAQRKLRAELRRFGPLQEDSVNAIEAQVRQYCELMGTMFPSKIIAAGPFKSYLVRDIRENLAGKSSPEAIAVALNFERPRPVLNGITIKRLELEKNREDLAKDPNKNQIRGAGVGTFSEFEVILSYLVSFYGRLSVIAEDSLSDRFSSFYARLHTMNPPPDFVRQLNDRAVRQQENDKTKSGKEPEKWKWHLKKWLDTAGQPEEHSIGIPEAIKVVKLLNHWWEELTKRRSYLLEHFGGDEFIEVTLLDNVLAHYPERGNFAHGQNVPNLPMTLDMVDDFRQVAQRLAEKTVVPPVHIVERRITMCDGTTRLDCRDEAGLTRHYRFQGMVKFYPLEECFFSLAIEDLKQVGNAYVCRFPPIILPVDINCRKEPI